MEKEETNNLRGFDPFKKDSLIQPNKVTTASYAYSATEENILTCIMASIQGHLTQEQPIQTDLFGSPIVRIRASQVASGKNKYHVINELRKLRKKDIFYSYEDAEGKKDVETNLISGHTDLADTDFIDVHLAAYSIPYLVYYGKGVGGTIYSKTLALTLQGKYTKRIYKMLKQWEDKGGVPTIDIEDFRHQFNLPKSYKNPYLLREKVLDPAKEELNKHGDITFEYSLTKVKSRSYNTLNIKIFSTKTNKSNDNTDHWYKFVYFFIGRTYPTYENDRAQRITDQLSSGGNLRAAFTKFSKLDDDFSNGKKNNEDVVKLTKYILKNDFGIETKGK
jgi:plasmid replication initiation protein